ncbi:hypothetical protein [Mycobacterium sp. Lab-001]|uniref:hypothetical protein n=1 Tax=Mycobacterium sp. Lab-001 TaxID=3410136 RepID=UPI003D180EE4
MDVVIEIHAVESVRVLTLSSGSVNALDVDLLEEVALAVNAWCVPATRVRSSSPVPAVPSVPGWTSSAW